MANSYNFRFGQRQLVRLAVDSGTVIEVGDMCYWNTDDVLPASSLAWNTNLATTQADFAALFCGIAAQSSASGDTDAIDIDISPLSVYEFTIASATVELDDSFGPDANSGGDGLLDQVLEVAANAASVAHPYGTSGGAAATKMKVTFAGAFQAASANVNGQIG